VSGVADMVNPVQTAPTAPVEGRSGGRAMARNRRTSLAFRSAIAFFLVTFSTAFLMTIGIRLTGWFTHAPSVTPQAQEGLGIAIMIGVVILAVGAAVRRLEPHEIRSALLGAASVLLSIPLSLAAINGAADTSTWVITGFGVVLLFGGLLVAYSLRERLSVEENNDG
jgi:uncharacterized membrane protein YidH (DUF202 family)